MSLVNPSTWKAYWVSEVTPGTTPTNPAFAYLGAVTSARASPSPNYKQVRASGTNDYYINQRMSLRPTMSVSVIPATVAFLTTLVSPTAQAFTIAVVDTPAPGTPFGSRCVRLRGAYVDRCRVNCDIEENVTVDLDLVGLTTDNTVPTLGSGSWASDAITALFYQDVTVSKDGTPITDWTRASFEVNKNFIRRFTPSTGNTRALETTARDHSLSISRDMITTDAFNEYADINANTPRTMKLKLDNSDDSASWAVTLNTARTTSWEADVARPEDIIGKDLSYVGTSITFGTS